MRIERATRAVQIDAAAHLFDAAPNREATTRFLASDNHHLLLAYDADDRPIGMVSGVELTHPDKGTEMFVYELGVATDAQRHGVGSALIQALAERAQECGCYGMWVGAEADNVAATATYRRAGATDEGPFVLLNWSFGDSSTSGE